MSKSYRKIPIAGNTIADSEKKDKRIWNKKFRRLTREKLRNDEEPPADIREVTEVWDGNKDGKRWFDDYDKVWRK